MRRLQSPMFSSFCQTLSTLTILLYSLAISLSWSAAAQEAAQPAKTAADYFIHHLPGAPEPLLKQHAGLIEITPEHNGNLFFWLNHNRHIADKSRLVIWVNGGPGCSSEDGALMEVGPYRVRKDGNLEYNDGAWDEFANLLFVDNPVGTGFSYVDTNAFIHELDEMAKQFVQFLEKFFVLFPDLSHDDIYIAGESYAGQHIPHIAKAIIDRNAQTDKKWNLSGLLIGNGWISAVDQYPSYLQYAYKNGMVKAGSPESTSIERQQNVCNEELSKGGKDHVDVSACEQILTEILYQTSNGTDDSRVCYNMYDIRLRDKHPSCGMNWPPDLESVTPYLRRKDVMEALHIDHIKRRTGWQECNGQVGQNFQAKNSVPSIQLLPSLLESVPITLFSGDRDLICNHLGTEELIHNLEWNGGKGFETSPGNWAPRRAWTVADEPAGFYQEARNLSYVLFYNSSHMVPFDYPRRSRAMLDRFMRVDISHIGGDPAVSVIGGEKDALTSVGETPNSTLAQAEQAGKIKEAQWQAYQRSGEAALVVVAIAASVWGFFVLRARKRRLGYTGVFTRDPDDDAGNNGLGLNGFAAQTLGKRSAGRSRANGDLEAADFDENELDDLAEASSNGSSGGDAPNGKEKRSHQRGEADERERFSLGNDSEDEDDLPKRRT